MYFKFHFQYGVAKNLVINLIYGNGQALETSQFACTGVSEIGGLVLGACSMDQNKRKLHKDMCPRVLGFFIMITFNITSHVKNSLFTNSPRIMDGYCHFQIHAVHMQKFHRRCSKCPPCSVKHDAAVLIS